MSSVFSAQVEEHFGRRASGYVEGALLQRAVAWRLVRHIRALPLPVGMRADLGAGSGAVAQALEQQAPQLLNHQAPLQVDLTAALLAQNPLATYQLLWDLNGGLPPQLERAALLTSSFALQWLDNPAQSLSRWSSALVRGGILALAVPTAGSFRQWHQAAEHSGVPCTALPLPEAEPLVAAASDQLELLRCQRLRFSRPASGLPLLKQMRAIGADATRAPGLGAGQLRRLLRHWPAGPTTWEVLLLVGRRP
jgi:malonyl-CoA O-methyltransferase